MWSPQQFGHGLQRLDTVRHCLYGFMIVSMDIQCLLVIKFRHIASKEPVSTRFARQVVPSWIQEKRGLLLSHVIRTTIGFVFLCSLFTADGLDFLFYLQCVVYADMSS